MIIIHFTKDPMASVDILEYIFYVFTMKFKQLCIVSTP